MTINLTDCAIGDAPSVAVPIPLTGLTTVNIAPSDNSVDTNNVIVTGSGTIASLGGDGTVLSPDLGSPWPVTKRVTWIPDPSASITLVDGPAFILLGNVNRTITHECIGYYFWDLTTRTWTELSYVDTTQVPGGGGGGAVTSWNTRTGAVSMILSDVTGVGGAPLVSPALTGTPTGPTAAPGNNSTQLATTAFVTAAVSAAGGVTSWNTRTGAVTMTLSDITGVGGAPLASPTFTGTPAAPTATAGTNTTQLATTAFVSTAITNANVPSPSASTPIMDGTGSAGSSAQFSRGDHVHPTDTSRAPLASPTFTGTPAAPTATAGTNTTQIATTAFVTTAITGVSGGSTNNIGRNLLDNSLMNVAQRGNGPWTTDNALTTDRWRLRLVLDTNSVTRTTLTDANRTTIGDEAAQFALTNAFTGNAGSTAVTWIQQAIENIYRLAGKTVSVSFWAVAASGTPKLGINILQFFGTGGSPTAAAWSLSTGQSVTLNTTWTRYTTTIAIPSIIGLTVGTNSDSFSGLSFFYTSGSGANAVAGNIGVQSGTISIWGIQVEIGSTATPLEKPNPQQEIARCQRFYQVGPWIHSGYNLASQAVAYEVLLPVLMRATPTIVSTLSASSNITSPRASADTAASFQVLGTVTANGAYTSSGTFTASADL